MDSNNEATLPFIEPEALPLTFEDLRAANLRRLPVFANRLGEAAHSKPDGSDWTPAMWFRALVGEIGEMADERMRFEADLDLPTFAARVRIGREAADVQTYLDLFCARAADITARHPNFPPHHIDAAGLLMRAMVHIGTYANLAKKHDRGEVKSVELLAGTVNNLGAAIALLKEITRGVDILHSNSQVTMVADSEGINLGEATREKFNKVSSRIGHPEIRL